MKSPEMRLTEYVLETMGISIVVGHAIGAHVREYRGAHVVCIWYQAVVGSRTSEKLSLDQKIWKRVDWIPREDILATLDDEVKAWMDMGVIYYLSKGRFLPK